MAKSLSDYVIDIIKANPEESQKGWEMLAWKEHQANPAMARAFFNYGIIMFWKNYNVMTAGPDEIAITPRKRHFKARARTARENKERQKMQRTVIGLNLFNWYMQQTCGALKKLGGVGLDLAKCGKPNQVLGSVISVTQAKDIFRRHDVIVNATPVEAATPRKKAA